jgi:hypothetical protein
MSLLARSCAALAISALAAGVVTIAPAGVAAASRDGASAFGTTETQPTSDNVYVSIKPGETVEISIPISTYQQPTSKTVRTPKRTPRGAAPRAGGAVGNNMPLGAIPVKTGSVGTAIVPQG